MQDEITHAFRAGPLAGIVMVAAGIGGYCYHTALRVLGTGHPMMAAAGHDGWSWDSVGQAVTAVLTIVGGVITWVSLQRSSVHRSLREEHVEDALADIQIKLAEKMAEIELRHAEHSADQKRQLDRQDATLAEIKQAVQAAPTPATPTPEGPA